MAEESSPSSSLKDSSLSSHLPSGSTRLVPPDGNAARDVKGHFAQPFRGAAVRYAVTCGKSQRLAAADMGISEKTLCTWVRDAQPSSAGDINVDRFDELAQLRADKRELLAQNLRLTQERDFLKKAAAYFATPTNNKPIGGSR